MVAVIGRTIGRPSRAARVGVRTPDLAAAAGAGARALLGAVTAVRGLVGLLLVSYGAWLAYEPAGFIVGGLGLVLDRLDDERKACGERRPE